MKAEKLESGLKNKYYTPYNRPVNNNSFSKVNTNTESTILKKKASSSNPSLHYQSSLSNSSNLSHDLIGQAKWTKQNWKILEEYYIKYDYNYEKAAHSFYLRESYQKIGNEEGFLELWSEEHIIWRCRCLDTDTRKNGGIVPSERKVKKIHK